MTNVKNTPGLGIEYEVHIPAYFTLLLNINENVEDFKLQSNAKDFGNLDDLLVDIQTKNRQRYQFGFQLKHKENKEKNLLPTNFGAKGDFNLEKYCEAFKNLKEENRKYHFILYTNKKFFPERANEVKIFNMVVDDRCRGKEFFNTSPNIVDVYKFETNENTENGKNVTKEDYRHFFSKFTLYTGQMNFDDLDKTHILNILKHKEQFLKYVDFFRRWHRGEFINKVIDKKTINIHIVDIFLSPFYIQNYQLSNGQRGNLELFESAVKNFDITILDVTKEKFISELVKCESSENLNNFYITSYFRELLLLYCKKCNINLQKFSTDEDRLTMECMIRLGKESKIIDRSTKYLTKDAELKVLYYFFEKPLIVDFCKSSESLIHHTMKLYKMKENNIKFVFLGQETQFEEYPHLRIFKNLNDLLQVNKKLYDQIITHCSLSLQGRNSISLRQLIELYNEIEEFTSPKEIFLMLKKTHLVGEEREDLPLHYVCRTVSTAVFDIKTIITQCIEKRDIVLIDFDGKLNVVKNLENRGVTVINIDKFLQKSSRSNRKIIVSSSKKRILEQFEEIVQQNKNYNIHFFQSLDEENFILVMSTRNIFQSRDFKLKKICFEEKDIYRRFNNPVNVVCAQPGMGKSTLLKYLKNECSFHFWPLLIDLKTFNSFLTKAKNCDKIVSHFMGMEDEQQDTFLRKLKNVFLKNRKIIMYLDGIDEIENGCVQKILDFSKTMSLMGYPVWLSSRQNLQRKLEEDFHLFVIEINELTIEQRENYIENRLKSYYDKDQIRNIIKQIFDNIYIANNYQILGVPLQLYIITQILLSDRKHYEDLNNIFVITKMYQIFFEGRYEYYIKKMENTDTHLTLFTTEDQLEKYEILALQALFDNSILQELNLDLRSNKRFLYQIKTDKDPLGIITRISDNIAVFEHYTFTEYFASKFFVNNFSKARILKKHIFTEKYQNLILMLNTMLAEENPLHLAMIYKEIDKVKTFYNLQTFDKGGRNLLQLATFSCTKYPSLQISRGVLFENQNTFVLSSSKVRNKFVNCLIKDETLSSFKEESDKELIDHLLQVDNPFKYENVFKWNSLNYALASSALYMVEAILEKRAIKLTDFKFIFDDYNNNEIITVIYYSLRFGYPNLLAAALFQINKKFSLTTISCSSLCQFESDCILRFSLMSECAKKLEIIKILLEENISVNSTTVDGYTLLHYAAVEGETEIINLLLDRKAAVDSVDNYGRTPLFLAVEEEKVEAASLLLDRGADVNVETNRGWTPLSRAINESQWNTDIVKLLLVKGANVNQTTRYGSRIIYQAALYKHLNLVQILMERGALYDGTLLHEATNGGNVNMIKMLLDQNFDINYQDRYGLHALHCAIKTGKVHAMKFLLKKGCSVNVLTRDGDSILHSAIWSAKFNPEILDILLSRDDTTELLYVANKRGLTPLHLAMYSGSSKSVEDLLNKGIDLDKIDAHNKEYPLYFAFKNGRLDANSLLEMARIIEEKWNTDYLFHNNVNIIRYLTNNIVTSN